jgi:Domain of unknown function (DUF1877)
MSMIGVVYAVPEAEARRILEDAEVFDELTQFDNPQLESVSLEKAWHGLHFLLNGSAWEGKGPLGFLVTGGEPIEDLDAGYGPPRLFTAKEVVEIVAAMKKLDHEQLWSRFDAQAMDYEGIYPGIWDEPEAELREEYTMYFDTLENLLEMAVSKNQGILVALS